MFVDDSRSAQPRPAPRVPVAGLLTRTHADPEVEPDLQREPEPEPEPTRTGVTRHDPATATSTFRLRNGAEMSLAGSFGGSRGVWSGAAARPRRQPAR